jgi:D-serine deaminase-like pyridoxal phosphate-dependent protein
VGICVAKVSEAAVMINAGIDRVLVTSPVVDAARVRLLIELAGRAAGLQVVVDSRLGLERLIAAADPAAPLGVLVDVDVAMGRTGNRQPDQIVALADAIAGAPGLRFDGVQHYAGHLMHVEGHRQRRDESLALWRSVAVIVRTLEDRGLAAAVVTGGGTGTYDIDCDVAHVTDLQVGSYVFMDQQYRLIGSRSGGRFDDFEVALSVAATAISQPRERTITVDAGFKAFASDTVNPEPLDRPEIEYRFAGDEHGVLLLGAPSQEPLLGRVQRFVTPHCDPTVNLYDWYWLCRDGLATELWPIAARGCSW